MTIESVRRALESVEAIKKMAAEWRTSGNNHIEFGLTAKEGSRAVASYLEMALALEAVAKGNDRLREVLLRATGLNHITNHRQDDVRSIGLCGDVFCKEVTALLAAKENDGR